MKWTQLITKGHRVIADILARLDTWEQRDANLLEAVKNNFAAERDALRKENDALLLQLAETVKFAVGDLVAAGKAGESKVGRFLAENQAVVTEMLGDAEEVRRTVERLHRREGEFTSMIDTRCRDIGAKIRESILGDLTAAADRVAADADKVYQARAEQAKDVDAKIHAAVANANRKFDLLAGQAEAAATKEEVQRMCSAVIAELTNTMNFKMAENRRPRR